MLTDWIAALERKGCAPKKTGDGYKALCPAHEDRNPSLSIKQGDSVVVVICFTGCTFEEIRAALGLVPEPVESRIERQNTPAPTHTAIDDQTDAIRRSQTPHKPCPLPTGPNLTQYIYRNADGSPSFAVIRQDLPDGKTFKQWTPEGDGWIPKGLGDGRPLYMLPDVLESTGSIAIVEGEKCVHAAKSTWPSQTVTTWAGGANAWNRTDWSVLAGRRVSLLADADDPGRRAMLLLAEHLAGIGCVVKIAQPEGDNGSDVADWIRNDGKDVASKRIAELLQPYQPPEPEQGTLPETKTDTKPEPAPLELNDTDLMNNEHYRLLGLVGDRIAVRIRAGQVLQRSREAMTLPATLIAIAPQTFWLTMTGADQLGTRNSRALGDWLIRSADAQGQVDLSSLWGRGASRLKDGRIAYHLGDRLLLDNELHDLNSDPNHIWLSEPRIDLSEPATSDQVKAVARAVMRYRWGDPVNGKRVLGWMVAAIIGGALDWRPHIMLTAPAAQGKSWLLKNVVERIMGPLLIRIADATPAGVARLTENSSLPIAIDEAEPSSPWVLELLQLLRYASGGDGLRIRADQAGGVTMQSIRISAFLSGTVAPQLQSADASRLTMVRFGREVEDWPSVRRGIESSMRHADGIRSKIIRSAPAVVAEVKRLTDEYQDHGMDSREAMASAALTAGWHFWGVDNTDVYAQDEAPETTDATDALHDLLSLRNRPAGGGDESVLEMVNNGHRHTQLADLYGVKMDGDSLLIAVRHAGLTREMLRTKWGNADLKRMLIQLPGVTVSNGSLRFGQVRKRAIVIPKETLLDIGIDLVEVKDE